MKELVLYNYKYYGDSTNPATCFHTLLDLENLENIKIIFIHILSGDEVATVVSNEGLKIFDSCEDRTRDYFDGFYPLYIKGLVNHIDEFLTRKDSNWRPGQ